MSEALVTIAEYAGVPQAELARGFLVEHGVLAILEGGQLATACAGLPQGSAVRLCVRASDAARAGRALAEVESRIAKLSAIVPEDECLSCGEPLASGATRCEACGWTWEHEIVS
jgi:hypothetical protein